jgi:hypothetical protein
MKKLSSLILKIAGGIILLLLLLLFIIPLVFKESLRTKVEQAMESSLNARIKFEDYSLSFFRNFPNLSFSLEGLTVTGISKFDNDTLASVGSFDLVFNLSSIFGKKGYEVKSIRVGRAAVKALVLKDGSVNWDIVKPSDETEQQPETVASSELKVLLKKVVFSESSLSYMDEESDIQALLADLDFSLSGDMTASETDLQITAKSTAFSLVMDSVRYMNRAVVEAEIGLEANLDSMKFTFRENWLSVNDLKVNFAGEISMPGDNISMNLSFKTPETSFRSLLSLIPAIYTKDYKDIRTEGEFRLNGSLTGTYSEADSTMPDFSAILEVNKGSLSYPELPGKITGINIKSDLFIDGTVMDRSEVNIDLLHLELAGNPFDMKFHLRTPVSDPDFSGSASGHLDLAALGEALPLNDMSLSGIIDLSLEMSGKMSALDNKQYEYFRASGGLGIKDIDAAVKGYPEVKIGKASFRFTPEYAQLDDAEFTVGAKSDFKLSGRLANYIPYIFRNKTVRGSLNMHSRIIDVPDLLSYMEPDTMAVSDTGSLALVRVPENIDFTFDAGADVFRYGKIEGKNAKGHLAIKNGILSIRDTGMELLDGILSADADYDTRDSLKPLMKADINMKDIAVKEAFNTFNSVKALVPAAGGIDGQVSLQLGFQSLLGRDMMPVTRTISGEGKLRSEEITLVKSETFNKVKDILKLGDKYSNTFRDVNISFRIDDGRIYVSPFDIRTGNLKMNISGDQGIDQSMNYLVKTEMPRSDLGSSVNSLIDNLSAQASAFGIAFKPSDVIRVNLRVKGTFAKPEVSPVFGNPEAGNDTGKVSTASGGAAAMAKGKAREEAQKEADRLLKEANEKGDMLKAEAAKAAQKIKDEADITAKKMIDESANKSQLEKMAAKQVADALKKNADKKAAQLVKEADIQASGLVEEAKRRGSELLGKIE